MVSIKDVLELNQLLALPDEILKISNSSQYIDLLSEHLCNMYYYTDIKKDIMKFISKFNDIKFVYQFADDYSLSSNNNSFEIRTISNPPTDKVFKVVAKNVDIQIYATNIYNKMISFANILTNSEAIYFVDTFFCNKTEENISEKLCICRKTLQKIKKSCLVKFYIEFKEQM